jgi:glycosyltransferase involved in cell wall biosynthesis
MQILFINESDLSGGASRAAYRLFRTLQDRKINSIMFTQRKESDDISVFGPASNIAKGFVNFRTALDHSPKLLYTKKTNSIFHLGWVPNCLAKKIKKHYSNIVHLHWICRGFMSVGSIAAFNKPVIWTLHDMWPFTGGCHYAGTCEGYTMACGKCPQLGSQMAHDLSSWTWRRKAKAWKHINITLVTPSMWMKKCAQKSSLFKDKAIEVIPNGIDLTLFRPRDKKILRSHLGLPLDKKLILFSAINAMSAQRKGFQFLLPALRQLSETKAAHNTEIIIMGASRPKYSPGFDLKSTYLGRIHDEILLALVYAACDVFLAPSQEDNLPNTIMESMACGTPCVAFRIGGIPDMISHKKNGYLAKPLSIEDLANGIKWIIEDDGKHQKLSTEARNKAELEFNIKQVAKRYHFLYKKVLNNPS